MLGQRVFRSMRVSCTVLRRLAQASSSSIPKPNSDFPRNVVLSQGRCQGKEAFDVCGFLPPRDWAQASSSSPQNISQRMLCFRRGFAWSEQHFAAASSARLQSRQGKRAAGELVPLGPCFSGLHVRVLGSPCQAKLSRHSHNPTVACVARDGTLCTLPSPSVGVAWPFTLALRRTRGLGQCFPHRKG